MTQFLEKIGLLIYKLTNLIKWDEKIACKIVNSNHTGIR